MTDRDLRLLAELLAPRIAEALRTNLPGENRAAGEGNHQWQDEQEKESMAHTSITESGASFSADPHQAERDAAEMLSRFRRGKKLTASSPHSARRSKAAR